MSRDTAETQRRYRYHVCDVFTSRRFYGNQLAVVLDAMDLSTDEMQLIAREFNYSETTFIIPSSESPHRQELRIFTTDHELPFAGHPNLGSAFVLASTRGDELFDNHGRAVIVFNEKAGTVEIQIQKVCNGSGEMTLELRAPQGLTLGAVVEPERVMPVIGTTKEAIITSGHIPRVASVGLNFIVVNLTDEALKSLTVNAGELAKLGRACDTLPYMYFYTIVGTTGQVVDIRARVFALEGDHNLIEDPATGSANCAGIALLAHLADKSDGEFRYRIRQAVEKGRESHLEGRVIKKGGKVASVFIGGRCVMTLQGQLFV